MSKPWIHSKSSAKKYGGHPNDYLEIHNFMDSTKAALADVRHRAILHSSFGCFLVEKVFGTVAINSDGKEYSPRDVAEDHCLEDLGFIPSMEKWLKNMPIESWMGGPFNKNEKIKREAQKTANGILDVEPFKNTEIYVDSANQHRLKMQEMDGSEVTTEYLNDR